jgi:hypothetical protein
MGETTPLGASGFKASGFVASVVVATVDVSGDVDTRLRCRPAGVDLRLLLLLDDLVAIALHSSASFEITDAHCFQNTNILAEGQRPFQ